MQEKSEFRKRKTVRRRMDGIGMFQNENGWNGNGWNENVTECLVKFQNDIEMYGMVTFQVENE